MNLKKVFLCLTCWLMRPKLALGNLKGNHQLNEEMLHECLVVADTVYKPLETKLIKMAKDYAWLLPEA